MYTGGIKDTLTDEEVKEAILWGSENKASPEKIIQCYIFGEEKEYNEHGYIWTKFFRLARLGYQSEATGIPLNEVLVDGIRRDRNLKTIIVTYGDAKGFADSYDVRLEQGQKKVLSQVVRPDKYDYTHLAYPVPPEYAVKVAVEALFLYSEIDRKAKTVIVLDKGEGREVPFPVNFSRYK